MPALEQAFAELKVAELEETIREMRDSFVNVVAHARCHVCKEPIDERRWCMAIVGDEQELIHAECYPKGAS